jgi:predicted RNA-binding Zn-ribbon protein involved in translation (DUF1610 family)
MNADFISPDAEVKISPTIHFECPACGADITSEFICESARHIYIDCPYCRTKLTISIDWGDRSDV